MSADLNKSGWLANTSEIVDRESTCSNTYGDDIVDRESTCSNTYGDDIVDRCQHTVNRRYNDRAVDRS